MEKTYLFSVKFTCRINEDVAGIGEIESMEFTRKFLDALRSDDEALLDIYKLHLFQRFIEPLEERDVFVRRLKIKDTKEIFLPLAEKIPPEAAAYFKQLYHDKDEPRSGIDFENWDKKRELLENQFGPLGIEEIRFEEIKR